MEKDYKKSMTFTLWSSSVGVGRVASASSFVGTTGGSSSSEHSLSSSELSLPYQNGTQAWWQGGNYTLDLLNSVDHVIQFSVPLISFFFYLILPSMSRGRLARPKLEALQYFFQCTVIVRSVLGHEFDINGRNPPSTLLNNSRWLYLHCIRC